MTAPSYPLMNLRSFVQDFLDDPEESTGRLYDGANFHIYEMENLIADYMLSTKSNDILKRYMLTLQEQLRVIFDQIPISWTEGVDIYAPEYDYDDPASRKSNICYEAFRLLKEIQVTYPAYFDKERCPPLFYIALENAQYYPKYLLVSEWISQKSEQFREVWQMIEKYIKRQFEPGIYRPSYHEIDYFRNLIDQVIASQQGLGDKFEIKSLYSLLIYINFNDITFLNHFTTTIEAEVDSIVLDFEKVNLLKQILQELDTTLARNDTFLDPGNPPMKDMLAQWIHAALNTIQS